MAWDTELVAIVRAMIGDDDPSGSFEFSDQRLLSIIAVSAFQVYQRIEHLLAFPYAIDVVNNQISPDPAGESLTDPNRNETLLNLTALKSSCTILRGSARRAINAGFNLRDKDLSIDTRAKAQGLAGMLEGKQSFCAEYETELDKFLNDSTAVVGAAVVGPYRVGVASGGFRRGALGYQGRRFFG